MAAALQVRNLTKELGGKVVLSNVSFEVQQGEIFGIIGMSGSGKTTLLSHLIGFLEPDEGGVLYSALTRQKNGAQKADLKNLHRNTNDVKKKFGFVPQTASFYPKLSVEENVVHFGVLHNLPKKEIMRTMNYLLALTKLDTHRKKLAEYLSGGMQRRLSIVCGLIHRPQVLILDEPTADLDPLLAEEVWKLITDINKLGTTVVVASHFLHELESVCNHVGIIHNGRMMKQGTLEEIKEGIVHNTVEINVETDPQYFASIIAAINRKNIISMHDQHNKLVLYTTHPQETLFELAHLIRRGDIVSHSLEVKRPTLKDVFELIAQKPQQ